MASIVMSDDSTDPDALVAVTRKVYDPGVDADPDKVPSVASDSPGGKLPDVTVYEVIRNPEATKE